MQYPQYTYLHLHVSRITGTFLDTSHRTGVDYGRPLLQKNVSQDKQGLHREERTVSKNNRAAMSCAAATVFSVPRRHHSNPAMKPVRPKLQKRCTPSAWKRRVFMLRTNSTFNCSVYFAPNLHTNDDLHYHLPQMQRCQSLRHVQASHALHVKQMNAHGFPMVVAPLEARLG